MPEALAQVLDTWGLIWLLLAVIVAGLVRGFSGFGSAMIIMPVASSILPPVHAVTFLIAAELIGPLPNLRAALHDGRVRDVRRLVLGAALTVPFGLWVLSKMDPTVFGWIVSALVLGLLALLLLGWRYRGALTRRLTVVTGALGGFMAGFAGLPGPPVIMLYLASTLPVSVIRANLLLYLVLLDLMLLLIVWMSGLMVWSILLLGLIFGLPNLVANRVGAMLFNPRSEGLFRAIAYIIIGCSAMMGLPLWKG